MNNGGCVDLDGALVEPVGPTVRKATSTMPSGSSIFPASSSRRNGSSAGLACGGMMAHRSRVRSSYSSTMRKSTCAMLPASMMRRSGVHVSILSERNFVDENAWAVMTMVKTVAPKHHICTDSHFTTRMITTGMWTRRITIL